MLDKEKELDAVITPTSGTSGTRLTSSRRASTCCEKEMSTTLEGARNMVAAARETGKLLQIGHQRRSNHLHCYDKLIGEAKLLGRVVTVNGQWNRGVTPDLGAPDRYAIPADRLKNAASRTCTSSATGAVQGLGGGPIVDLGSHQIDIYSWFLSANPSHVTASGGLLYYDPKNHEWYDTVMVVYDYATPLGPAKAYYQTQTTNGSQGYFENFMGDQGTLIISESELNYAGQVPAIRTRRRGTSGFRRATSARHRFRKRGRRAGATCASRSRRTCGSGLAQRPVSPPRICRTSSTPCAARRN